MILMKKIKTSSRRRVCRARQCEQVLSIYNHEAYCHAHLKDMNFLNEGAAQAMIKQTVQQ